MNNATEELEPVEDFRARARMWLKENMPPAPLTPRDPRSGDDDEDWARARELQKLLHAGGFAGICFPSRYGGLGLTPAHQVAFNEESAGYEMPTVLNIPSLAICAATLLDVGSEEQKTTHLPRIISGEEIWCQFLSEPRGGSDLAGVTTRAVRDGDDWVLNGSKIWSSAAYAADYGLCLARSNWDVPKHQGLTMFAMPTADDGVTIRRIKLVSGSTEFCQAYFDDVRLPASAVVGAAEDGWTIASRQLFHERNSMGGGSPYISGPRFRSGSRGPDLVDIARRTGSLKDPVTRDQLAGARIMELVAQQLVRRVGGAIRSGQMSSHAASLMRLFSAEKSWAEYDAAINIAGAAAATGADLDELGLGETGLRYLSRQAGSLGGGSTEMARNIISERVLGMPREFAPDRDVPFRDVRQGR